MKQQTPVRPIARSPLRALALAGLLTLGGPAPAPAQGLPKEMRDNIHLLFDRHAAVQRTVTLTDTGYVALTESDDPEVARTLRAHVAQMRERLASGLAVRRWDPAYEEMVRHYPDLELKVEATDKGLRAEMRGRTPAAVQVARNHAQIVSRFVERGWAEHDVRHPAVAAPSAAPADKAGAAAGNARCCQNAACGAECRRQPDKPSTHPQP